MSGLSDFRAQYPQYDDVSDLDLANSLHEKFYSDIPKDKYLADLGVSAPKTVLLDSIKSAIFSGDKPSQSQGASGYRSEDAYTPERSADAINAPGSVMDGFVPTVEALPTTSRAPVRPEVRKQIESAFDASTPDTRQKMAEKEGWVGQIAADRAGVFGMQDKAGTTVEEMDPRVEARKSRLVAAGEDPLFAERAARVGAASGAVPGREIAALGSVASESGYDFDTNKLFAPGEESNGLNNPVVRGLARGGVGVVKAVSGLNQALAEAVGADDYAAWLRNGGDWARGKEAAIGEGGTTLERNLEGAINSIAQQLPLMASGSEALAMAGMIAQSFGQEYSDGRSQGQSVEDARQRAAVLAAFEGIGEKFGLKGNFAAIKAAARGKPTEALVGFLTTMVKKDLPGEMLTTTGQFVADKYSGKGVALNPNATFGDYLQQMSDTVIQTVMQGGIMAGGGAAVGRIMPTREASTRRPSLAETTAAITDPNTTRDEAEAIAKAAVSAESTLDSAATVVSNIQDRLDMNRADTDFRELGNHPVVTDTIVPNDPEPVDPAVSEQRQREADKADAQVTFAVRQAFSGDAAVTMAIDKAEAENATLEDREAAAQAVQDAFARNPEVKNNAFAILTQLRNQGKQDVAQTAQAKQSETQRQEEQPAATAVDPQFDPATNQGRMNISTTARKTDERAWNAVMGNPNITGNARIEALQAIIATAPATATDKETPDISSNQQESVETDTKAPISAPSAIRSKVPTNQVGDTLKAAILRITGGRGLAQSMALDWTGDTKGGKLIGLFNNKGQADLSDPHLIQGLKDEGYFVNSGEDVARLIDSASRGNSPKSAEGLIADAEKEQEAKYQAYLAEQENGGIPDGHEIEFSTARDEQLYTDEDPVFTDEDRAPQQANETEVKNQAPAPKPEPKPARADAPAHPQGSQKRVIQEALTSKTGGVPEITLHTGLKPAGKISRATFKALNAVARIFKQKVVYYSSDRTTSDGFIQNGTIYLNVNSSVSAQALLGHEITHRLMQEMPNAWKAVAATLAKRMDRTKLIAMFRSYNAEESAEMTDAQVVDALNKKGVLEHLMGEMVSDFAGNQFTDAKFWGDVFSEIIAVHPEGVAKKLITQLRLAVMKMVSAMNAAIKQGRFQSAWLAGETDAKAADEWTNEVNAALKTAYAKWIIQINEKGYQQAQGDARVRFSQDNMFASPARQDDLLSTYSNADLRQRGSAAAQKAKSETAEQTRLANKQKADAERGSFNLTGSDRAADVLGQGALFSPSRLTAAWTELTKNDEIFSYPKSNSKSMEEIAATIARGLTVVETDVDDTFAHGWLVYNGPERGGRPDAFIMHYADGKVELNVLKFGEGQGGSALYSAVGTYAHNNGLVFSGDRQGISDKGKERRLENMISLALKFRSTDFLLPHPDMNLDWKEGDFEHNMEEMLNKSYANAIKQWPWIKDYYYDFDSGIFRDNGGNAVALTDAGENDFEGGVSFLADAGSGSDSSGYAGSEGQMYRTVKRAIFTHSVLRTEGGKDWAKLLGNSGELDSSRVVKDYEGVAYSTRRNELPDESTPHRSLDGSELAALRRTAAGIERPNDGVFLRVESDGRAIATGPKGTRIPETFRRFAHAHDLAFYAERRVPKAPDAAKGEGSNAANTPGGITRTSEPMPIAYRESGARYFGEDTGESVDRTDRVRFSTPRFVSQLATQIDKVPDRLSVQPGKQWVAWIQSNAAKLGIKKDEITWSGLLDYLDLKGKEKVTKAEIGAFLSENGTQRRQTETPEFKKWFGDWQDPKAFSSRYPKDKAPVSHAVNEDGTPMVLYHATNGDFNVFETGRKSITSTTFGEFETNRHAIFTTPEVAFAESYLKKSGGQNVMPVYVDIKSPMDLRNNAAWDYVDALHENGFESIRWPNLSDTDMWQMFDDETGVEFVKAAKKAGYDGAIMYEVNDDDKMVPVYAAFDPAQIKSAIGNNGQFDPSNPDIRRSTNRSATTGKPINQSWTTDGLIPQWDDFVRAMQDKHIDTKRVLAEIRKAGVAIRDNIDPYLQEVLFHGRAAKRVSDFADNELKPLLIEMAARQIDRQVFEDYLWARHAVERNTQIAAVNPSMPDGGSGLTNKEAVSILSGQKVTVGGRDIQIDPAKTDAYQSLAKRIDAITKETTDTLVRYGLESQDTVDAWRATYGSYVPLMRDMEADDNYAGAFGLGLGTGQGFSVRGSAAKRAMGSDKGVIDILANVAMQRERAIVRGEKNRVAQATYGLAITAPNPDFWLALNPDAQKSPADVIAELIQLGLNPIDAENSAKEPKQRYIDPRTGLVMERLNPQLRSRGDVMAVRINGKDRFIMFSSDARAQKMVSGLKNLDADQLPMALQGMAVVTRWFASINTQFNPVFGLTNGVRDLGTGMLNLTSTELKGHQAEVFKNAFSALRGVYADLRDHRAGRTPSSKWALEFEEFASEGGQTGYRDMFQTSKARTDALMKELDGAKKGNTLLTFSEKRSPLFGWLSDYNTSIENAVRLSAYKAAKDSGMTKQQAASLAKNLTVNFNKKGNAATQLGAMYAFFNAAVQGTSRIGETMLTNATGKTTLSSAGKKILYGGMLAGVLQAVMFALAGYDDEEPPQFSREKNFIIPDFVTGSGKYVSIPYPMGFHIIPNIGRITTEFALGGFRNPGKRMTDIISMVIDGFNPIGSSAGGVGQLISPTATDPFVALSENKDWTGKNIYKEDFNKMHPTAGWTRKKDSASQLGDWVSYGVNYITGGGKYEIGLLSPTPDQIDYLVSQATGGVGREALKAWEFGTTAYSGEEMPMHKVPVAGRFVGETTGQASETSKFYNNLKRIGEHKYALDGMKEAGDKESWERYLESNPDARLVKLADKLSSKINEIKREKRKLLEGDASKERIKLVEMKLTAAVKRANERLSAGARQEKADEAGGVDEDHAAQPDRIASLFAPFVDDEADTAEEGQPKNK